MLVRWMAGAVLSGMLVGGAAAQTEPTAPGARCAMETLETAPEALIAPCSQEIDRADIAVGDRAQAFYLRARGYHRTGRAALAAQDYDVAIKLAPDRSDYYVHRANTELRRGAWPAFSADIEKALTLDPRNALAYRTLGQAYKCCAPEKAIDFFSQALAIDPGEPYALMFRSQELAKLHRYDEAMRDADALVAIPPAVINRLGYVDAASKLRNFHAVAIGHRADLLLEIGRRDEAARDYDAAIAIEANPDLLGSRGEYRLSQPGMAEAAVTDLEAAASDIPDDPWLLYTLGLARLGVKRYAAAVEAFDKVPEDDPNGGPAQMLKARSLRGLGRTAEAVRTFEHAIAIDDNIRKHAYTAYAAAGYMTLTASTQPDAAAQHAAAQACMVDMTCN